MRWDDICAATPYDSCCCCCCCCNKRRAVAGVDVAIGYEVAMTAHLLTPPHLLMLTTSASRSCRCRCGVLWTCFGVVAYIVRVVGFSEVSGCLCSTMAQCLLEAGCGLNCRYDRNRWSLKKGCLMAGVHVQHLQAQQETSSFITALAALCKGGPAIAASTACTGNRAFAW
jgi:hypothetical protein